MLIRDEARRSATSSSAATTVVGRQPERRLVLERERVTSLRVKTGLKTGADYSSDCWDTAHPPPSVEVAS